MRQYGLGRQLWDHLPVKNLRRVRHQVEDVLNARLVMRTDVVEHDDDYVVTAELPGFDKEAITVTYQDNWLTIRAYRSQTDGAGSDDERIIHRERTGRALTRRFHVQGVVKDQIQAHYQAGVLTVNLPKKVRDSAGKIEIQ
ncbi:Hsp20/alpha crystallin family protein [Lactiplantibacillus garii]|uniref:Hsp20/alpha crystallin family protein n=1 Tax=Lactiplantibacillus garii TaxID=2306423 RepID=A0A3R8L1G3_9LACO|nr:Hsp20/alpha crystallin family protein [Lactiplantibacillus garii]RRK10651.1 Hsp20/alpha crystallin family protein [Lactiplantibacillus garii]